MDLSFENYMTIKCKFDLYIKVIKARVKASLENKQRRGQARRRLAKGEASAKTRSQRDNRDEVRGSQGIWG